VSKKKVRVGNEIDAPQVRLIDDQAQQVGIVPIAQALEQAERAGLSLVEVSPNAVPPVCKIMDYGRHVFGQKKKHQKPKKVKLKEIKMRPTTEENDYQVKLKQVIRFLGEGNKVKVTIRFRGREVWYRDLAVNLFKRIEQDISEHGLIEQQAKLEGRQMAILLVPGKTKHVGDN
jgi:translation initiation factor IF-3